MDAVRCPKCTYVYWTRSYENWGSCDNCGSNNDKWEHEYKEGEERPLLVWSDLIFKFATLEDVKKSEDRHRD